MVKRSIARRYARALMELVEADPQAVAEQIAAFNRLLMANPILAEILSSPAFQLSERQAVLGRLLERLEWGPPLDRFLWYLVEQRRVAYLGAIVESFIEMVDEREERARVLVESAVKLDRSALGQLQKALAEGLGKQVVMEQRVDPDLIAGLSVRMGSLVIDGTFRAQLKRLEQVLVRRRV